jgi:hypothetical protein
MKKSEWIMHEFSLIGKTNWVLCTVHKKRPEPKSGLERRFKDQSYISDQVPATIVPLEIVTPNPGLIQTCCYLRMDPIPSRERGCVMMLLNVMGLKPLRRLLNIHLNL